MTDAVHGGTEWVPRFGMLEELPSGHAAVIRGLFKLAAFVADHPELHVPSVRAVLWPPSRNEDFEAACREVDQVGAVLGAEPELNNGHYAVTTGFGPVEVTSFAISSDTMAAHTAHMSYADNVQPEQVSEFDESAPVAGVVR
ncbi:hypothetical protein EV646_112176 [Kribbella antiqua]|uniref:Uncharacterized protein n=1 Tax=Kribbella antiqua TaxID=2512217 RepID=A0A4R2IIF8_9ACTN|nr:hypothetical protein [Kribbella antiqua]TCO43599.1 hypothetical protein EV646_112176 [Kribbella antiqua]